MPVSMSLHPLPAPALAARLHYLMSSLIDGNDDQHAGPARLIETHMSWVVLRGARAWKIKKPVRMPFVDFTALDARERDATDEWRLNQRLAPGVYLGVRALVLLDDGELALLPAAARPSRAHVLDWVVEMQRLPDESMLDHALKSSRVMPEAVDRLVDTLCRFYRHARRADVCGVEYVERLQREQQMNREVLLAPAFDTPWTRQVCHHYEDALAECADELQARATRQRLVDGHGDMRPEHVCLLDPPVVIDCLEFSTVLREVDPFDELAYLGAECEMAAHEWIGPRAWARAQQRLDDMPPHTLYHLYAARRCLLRARFTLAHLLDPPPVDAQQWQRRTAEYIHQAQAELDRLESR